MRAPLGLLIKPTIAAAGGSSVHFDASTDYYNRASIGTISASTVTVSFWAKLQVDRDTPVYFFSIDDGGGWWWSIGTTSDGLTLRATSTSDDLNIGSALSLNTWYFIANVTNTGGTDTLYWAAEGAGSLSSRSGLTIVPGNYNMYIGTSGYSQWINGNICAVKIWSAALTQTELDTERGFYAAQRTSGLYAAYSFQSGPQTTDDSGNSRTLTANGTLTSEAGPSIS